MSSNLQTTSSSPVTRKRTFKSVALAARAMAAFSISARNATAAAGVTVTDPGTATKNEKGAVPNTSFSGGGRSRAMSSLLIGTNVDPSSPVMLRASSSFPSPLFHASTGNPTNANSASSPIAAEAAKESSSGNSKDVQSSNYRVYIRVRPFLPADRDVHDPNAFPLPPFELRNEKECVFIDQTTGMPKEVFHFDGAFCSISPEQWGRVPELESLPKDSPFFPRPMTQADMYNACAEPLVSYVLEGFNASILAYGQTSSGKTFTMTGVGGDETEGIIPRLCRDLLKGAADVVLGGGKFTDFTMEVAYFEIYNENVLDLLDNGVGAGFAGGGSTYSGSVPNGSSINLHGQHRKRKVRSHPVLGVFIDGLTFETVTSWDQCAKLISRAIGRRHVASTKMNDQSSRSHAVMQLRMTQTERTDFGPLQRRSNVHLADLAGSERIKASQVEGERLKEAAQINLSLTTLRRVIDALIAPSSKGGRQSDLVPYRDSLLTWVLSDSLGGNAKSCMIATLCPHPNFSEESFHTLQYASRAKSIVSNVVRNEDQMAQMIRSLQETIAKEAAATAQQQLLLGSSMPQAPSGPSEEQLAEMREAKKRAEDMTEENKHLQAEMRTVREALRISEAELFHSRERLESEANGRRMAEDRINSLFDELEGLRADVVLLEDRLHASEHTSEVLMRERTELQYERDAIERELQLLAAERSDVEGRVQAEATAFYSPMLRWYGNVVATLEETFFHSARASFTAAVVNTAVHQSTMLREELSRHLNSTRGITKALENAERVNRDHHGTISRIAAQYVRVRDYLTYFGGGGAGSTPATRRTNGSASRVAHSSSSAYYQNKQHVRNLAAECAGQRVDPTELFTRFSFASAIESPLQNGGGNSHLAAAPPPSLTSAKELIASFNDFVRAAESEAGIVSMATALNMRGDFYQRTQCYKCLEIGNTLSTATSIADRERDRANYGENWRRQVNERYPSSIGSSGTAAPRKHTLAAAEARRERAEKEEAVVKEVHSLRQENEELLRTLEEMREQHSHALLTLQQQQQRRQAEQNAMRTRPSDGPGVAFDEQRPSGGRPHSLSASPPPSPPLGRFAHPVGGISARRPSSISNDRTTNLNTYQHNTTINKTFSSASTAHTRYSVAPATTTGATACTPVAARHSQSTMSSGPSSELSHHPLTSGNGNPIHTNQRGEAGDAGAEVGRGTATQELGAERLGRNDSFVFKSAAAEEVGRPVTVTITANTNNNNTMEETPWYLRPDPSLKPDRIGETTQDTMSNFSKSLALLGDEKKPGAKTSAGGWDGARDSFSLPPSTTSSQYPPVVETVGRLEANKAVNTLDARTKVITIANGLKAADSALRPHSSSSVASTAAVAGGHERSALHVSPEPVTREGVAEQKPRGDRDEQHKNNLRPLFRDLKAAMEGGREKHEREHKKEQHEKRSKKRGKESSVDDGDTMTDETNQAAKREKRDKSERKQEKAAKKAAEKEEKEAKKLLKRQLRDARGSSAASDRSKRKRALEEVEGLPSQQLGHLADVLNVGSLVVDSRHPPQRNEHKDQPNKESTTSSRSSALESLVFREEVASVPVTDDGDFNGALLSSHTVAHFRR